MNKKRVNNMRINSIYLGSEGEGIWIGTPQIFLRLQGCSLHCSNCDSKESWSFEQGEQLAPTEVVQQVLEMAQTPSGHPIKRLSITGGDPDDPRHLPDLLPLIGQLKRAGFYLHLESSGSRVEHSLFDHLDFISIDYKLPSTGVTTELATLKEMAHHYAGRFQVKSVVESEDDFATLLAVREELPVVDFPWVITPAYNRGEEFPRQRFLTIFQLNLEHGGPFRVIGQQHKWLYGADQLKV
ncbi:MAG: 7-carboxy-7-deazaguanine synthase QueE [Bdellovibrionales bacterium]|nr:7-carboxy-7-deazaguanine synthase QueE [Bdellovibrionales bacterium]